MHTSTIFLLLLLLPAFFCITTTQHIEITAPHNCVHDLVSGRAGPAVTGLLPNSDSTTGTTNNNKRSLLSGSVVPLAFSFQYPFPLSTDSSMTSSKIDFVGRLLIDASTRLSALLAVPDTSNTPLYAHRECKYVARIGGLDVCVEYVATECATGSDELIVPFNSTLFGEDIVYSRTTGDPSILPAGNGITGASFGVFVTAIMTSTCLGGTLAYAVTCQRDALTDRPTWARINLCPQTLDITASQYHNQLATVTHELVHALGFSSSGYAYFRDSTTGLPRTPRNPADPTLPNSMFYSHFRCPNGGSAIYADFFASPNTIAYSPERGMQCEWSSDGASLGVTSSSWLPLIDGKTSRGDCVARVNTPVSIAASRDYFGCSTLGGPELENDMAECSFYGSHWEQRVLPGELMASYISHYPVMSVLTAAFFADSGWYRVNFTAIDGTRGGARSETGYKQGCAYANEQCSANNAGIPPAWSLDNIPHSASIGTALCTPDLRAFGFTMTAAYSTPLSNQYRYFSNTADGGEEPSADFCPIVWAYSNGLCALSTNAPMGIGEATGETYGNSSVCLSSTLKTEGFSTRGAGCYQFECSTTGVVTIILGGNNERMICHTDGQILTSLSIDFSGHIVCPTASAVCGAPTRVDASALAVAAAALIPSPTSAPIVAPGGAIRLALFFKLSSLTTASFSTSTQTLLANALSNTIGVDSSSTTAAGVVPVYLDEDAGLSARRRVVGDKNTGDDVLVARLRQIVPRRNLDPNLPHNIRRSLGDARTQSGMSVLFTIDAASVMSAGVFELTSSSSLATVALAIDRAVKTGLIMEEDDVNGSGSLITSPSWSSVATAVGVSVSALTTSVSIDATRPTSYAGGGIIAQVGSITSLLSIVNDPSKVGPAIGNTRSKTPSTTITPSAVIAITPTPTRTPPRIISVFGTLILTTLPDSAFNSSNGGQLTTPALTILTSAITAGVVAASNGCATCIVTVTKVVNEDTGETNFDFTTTSQRRRLAGTPPTAFVITYLIIGLSTAPSSPTFIAAIISALNISTYTDVSIIVVTPLPLPSAVEGPSSPSPLTSPAVIGGAIGGLFIIILGIWCVAIKCGACKRQHTHPSPEEIEEFSVRRLARLESVRKISDRRISPDVSISATTTTTTTTFRNETEQPSLNSTTTTHAEPVLPAALSIFAHRRSFDVSPHVPSETHSIPNTASHYYPISISASPAAGAAAGSSVTTSEFGVLTTAENSRPASTSASRRTSMVAGIANGGAHMSSSPVPENQVSILVPSPLTTTTTTMPVISSPSVSPMISPPSASISPPVISIHLRPSSAFSHDNISNIILPHSVPHHASSPLPLSPSPQTRPSP